MIKNTKNIKFQFKRRIFLKFAQFCTAHFDLNQFPGNERSLTLILNFAKFVFKRVTLTNTNIKEKCVNNGK